MNIFYVTSYPYAIPRLPSFIFGEMIVLSYLTCTPQDLYFMNFLLYKTPLNEFFAVAEIAEAASDYLIFVVGEVLSVLIKLAVVKVTSDGVGLANVVRASCFSSVLIIKRTTSAVLVTFLYTPPFPRNVMCRQNVINNSIVWIKNDIRNENNCYIHLLIAYLGLFVTSSFEYVQKE